MGLGSVGLGSMGLGSGSLRGEFCINVWGELCGKLHGTTRGAPSTTWKAPSTGRGIGEGMALRGNAPAWGTLVCACVRVPTTSFAMSQVYACVCVCVCVLAWPWNNRRQAYSFMLHA